MNDRSFQQPLLLAFIPRRGTVDAAFGPPPDTALKMIRSRHVIGRQLASLTVVRSTGHLPAAAARAVSGRHELPCPQSSSASSSASAPAASCSTIDQHRQYSSTPVRSYSASTYVLSSPFSGGIGGSQSSSSGKARRKGNRRRKFIPRKAAVALTPKARTFFKSLLENATTNQSNNGGGNTEQSDDAIIGIQLTYSQSTTGEPRMVFGFSFLRASALHPNDEAVSLEVLEDGEAPKPPADALEDGLPKLYMCIMMQY